MARATSDVADEKSYAPACTHVIFLTAFVHAALELPQRSALGHFESLDVLGGAFGVTPTSDASRLRHAGATSMEGCYARAPVRWRRDLRATGVQRHPADTGS